MNDIVERLRVKWDIMGDMANAERDEAAYAIICLRNECAMEVAHTKEIRQQVMELRAERDALRRTLSKMFIDPVAFAESKNWDCFKEKA